MMLINNLLKPYKGRNLTAEQEYFNIRLSHAQRVVECAFDIINAKFSLLWKHLKRHHTWLTNLLNAYA